MYMIGSSQGKSRAPAHVVKRSDTVQSRQEGGGNERR
jgi:hypothetical protein